MSNITFQNSNNPEITISAVINFPVEFDVNKTYPAIIVSHPAGGVKEQTAGTYARELSGQGFITIVFDRSYQGSSSGEPRQLENPYISTEDVSAVVDYLTTLSYVDNSRIGALGICAGGGYTVNAAIQDHRIKAVGGVSAVNYGMMFRNGWENTKDPIDALSLVLDGSEARTADMQDKKKYAMMPITPEKEDDAPNEELRQAWEYYRTPRAECPNAPSYSTLRSLSQLATYDAFNFADLYLTQPIQLIVGSNAGTAWMSYNLYDRAASDDKSVHEVQGANHMELYDDKNYVAEAVSVLASFFQKKLAEISG